MNPVEIVMLVCLLANPNVCEERHLQSGEGASLARCTWEAQMQMAEWASTHPKYTIRKWHCDYVKAAERHT